MALRIKFFVDHYPSLQWIDALARKLKVDKIMNAVWDRQDKDEHVKRTAAFWAFYNQHEQEFRRVSEMLEDDFSRYTLEKVLQFRKTFDRSILKDVNVQPQYFQKDILSPAEDEVFVDGGAYVGDTVENFIKYFSGGVIQKNIFLGTG